MPPRRRESARWWARIVVCLFAPVACGQGLLGGEACRAEGYAPTLGDVLWDPGELGDDFQAPVAEFRVGARLSYSAIDQFDLAPGGPVNLTWGIVPDGTTVVSPLVNPNDSLPSDLIETFDAQFGPGPLGFESSEWFALVKSSFDRWSEVSGVTFFYEPADSGDPVDRGLFPIGVTGVDADVRLGGRSLDGSVGPNTLAFAYFPDHADIVLDTDNAAFFGTGFSNSILLRNTLMHEIGHALGLNHLVSEDTRQLLEPVIGATTDGPQIDDILGVQRLYGDALEKNGGNDTAETATAVGLFSVGQSWTVGADGESSTVAPEATDFVSIDGVTDADFYSFQVDEPVRLDAGVRPVGLAYSEGAGEDDQALFDASRQSELGMLILESAPDGIAVRGATFPGFGDAGAIEGVVLLPGVEYLALVAQQTGTDDNVQLYRLDLAFAEVPEPAGGVLIVAGFVSRRLRRRRRGEPAA